MRVRRAVCVIVAGCALVAATCGGCGTTGWTAATEKVKVGTPKGDVEKAITYYTNSIGMKLVYIRPGTFMMGSPEGEGSRDERPRHRVTITKGFYMAAHEVTVGQFRQFVDAAGYRTDAEKGTPDYQDGKRGGYTFRADGKGWGWREDASWRNPGFAQTDNDPVVLMSWNDAAAFFRWLSKKEGRTYRLPTEAEWEYACRAGTATRYGFGDADAELGRYAWYVGNAERRTHPVGQKKPNAWGLYDTHGNAWEWCGDWYAADYYGKSPQSDPQGPASGQARVVRGGAWYGIPIICRSASCYGFHPSYRSAYAGFRGVSPRSSE